MKGMSFMDSNTVTIRPISIDDFEEVLKWSTDDAFCIANEWELHRDPREVYDWWKHCVELNTTDFIRFGIEWNDRLIGYADLANIQDNVGELGIAIGDSTLWGKGIGSLAANQFMAYVSTEYSITVFHAETHETNLRSQKMLEKLGFQEVSRIGFEDYKGIKTQLIQYQLMMASA